MMIIIKNAILFIGFTLLASCSIIPEKEAPPEKTTTKIINETKPEVSIDVAEQKVSDFKLNKSSFYGYKLLEPIPRFASKVTIQKDIYTGGTKFILPDPQNAFSFITLYQNNGVLTRLTLTRKDTHSSQSNAFYKMLIKQAEQKYPEEILVDSGIGAYMHFYNSKEQWKTKYREFLENKKNEDIYHISLDKFHYGLHDSLKTVSIDQFPGKQNETYVKVDYITSSYEEAVIGEIEKLETASGISDI